MASIEHQHHSDISPNPGSSAICSLALPQIFKMGVATTKPPSLKTFQERSEKQPLSLIVNLRRKMMLMSLPEFKTNLGSRINLGLWSMDSYNKVIQRQEIEFESFQPTS